MAQFSRTRRALTTVVVALALVVAPGLTASQGVAAATTQTTIYVSTHNGSRPVYLSIPTGFPAMGGRVIVLLHGADSSPEAMERVSRMNSVAGARGVAVASLRSLAVPGRIAGWNAGSCCYAGVASRADDVGYVAAAVTMVKARLHVNATQITLVGYSNGGMLAYRVICERPGLVGRLAAFHATRLTGCRGGTASPPTAILDVQGSADATVPLNGTRWQPDLKTALPGVTSAVIGAGARAGCTSFVRLATIGHRYRVVGRGCRAPVTLLVVLGLTHTWTRSPLIDETHQAVAFATG